MLTGTAASVCALPDDVAAVFEQLSQAVLQEMVYSSPVPMSPSYSSYMMTYDNGVFEVIRKHSRCLRCIEQCGYKGRQQASVLLDQPCQHWV